MNERELFEEKYKELTGCDDSFFLRKKDGDYKFSSTYFGWLMWQASANREGYKLVPVDLIERCIGHISLASCHPANDLKDDIQMSNDIDSLEKYMIGATP